MMRPYLLIALSVFAITIFGCRSSEEKAERARTQQYTRDSEAFSKIADEKHAVTNWQSELKKVSYTVQVTKLFVRADQRPFLFYAMLEDVREENGKTLLIFDTTPTQDEPMVRLVLACGACDVHALMESEKGIGGFALLAHITQAANLIDSSENTPDYRLDGDLISAEFIGDLEINKVLARRKKENDE